MRKDTPAPAAFFTGMGSMGALTGGISMLLYTGHGFLRTTGMLLGITIAAVAAGLWAGDDASRSTRIRTFALMAAYVGAAMYAAAWATSAPLRDGLYGGSLAVLLLLALPAYVSGALLAGFYRHSNRAGHVGVPALAGASVGIFIVTTFMVPNVEAWGVYFAAASLLIPTVLTPLSRLADNHTEGGVMQDRVAIITGVGGAGQLGYAIAQRFLAAGARLVIVDRTDDIRSNATHLGERDRVIGVRADLTAPADVEEVVRAAASLGRLDVLVNVAGGLTVTGSVADTSEDAFRREMSINAETMLTMSRAALPLLRESRGAIVNFASPAGERAIAGMGAYSAAKAAVIALTRAMALEEVANGVRVNAVAPGMIDTVQNRAAVPEGTMFVTREQVAEVVLFLASDAGSGVTAETLHVEGAAVG